MFLKPRATTFNSIQQSGLDVQEIRAKKGIIINCEIQFITLIYLFSSFPISITVLVLTSITLSLALRLLFLQLLSCCRYHLFLLLAVVLCTSIHPISISIVVVIVVANSKCPGQIWNKRELLKIRGVVLQVKSRRLPLQMMKAKSQVLIVVNIHSIVLN